jgi:hypothetical protein
MGGGCYLPHFTVFFIVIVHTARSTLCLPVQLIILYTTWIFASTAIGHVLVKGAGVVITMEFAVEKDVVSKTCSAPLTEPLLRSGSFGARIDLPEIS